MNKDFILYTQKSDQISCTTYGFENRDKAPCIIIAHGFKGFKDWGFFPYSAEKIAEKGFFVITFNFSHNGIGKVKDEFTELDKFADNTYSLEIDELSDIIDGYTFGFFENENVNKIGLLGHSRGGAISLIAARKTKKVDTICLWASMGRFDKYTDHQVAQWKDVGFLEVVNSRTNQKMKLNYSFLEDVEKNLNKKLSLEKALKTFKKPLLIIHGDQDLSVPVEEAYELFAMSNEEKSQLKIIENIGHTFGAVHPFDGSNPKLDEVINSTINFFSTNLL